MVVCRTGDHANQDCQGPMMLVRCVHHNGYSGIAFFLSRRFAGGVSLCTSATVLVPNQGLCSDDRRLLFLNVPLKLHPVPKLMVRSWWVWFCTRY